MVDARSKPGEHLCVCVCDERKQVTLSLTGQVGRREQCSRQKEVPGRGLQTQGGPSEAERAGGRGGGCTGGGGGGAGPRA